MIDLLSGKFSPDPGLVDQHIREGSWLSLDSRELVVSQRDREDTGTGGAVRQECSNLLGIALLKEEVGWKKAFLFVSVKS